MARDVQMPLPIDDIIIPDGRRQVQADAVKRLADSIDKIGLRQPITVHRKGDRYVLIAGRHRLEACRLLDRDHIPSVIVSMTNADARLWEIAENLHRSELSNIERAEHIAEWRRLAGKEGGNRSPPGVRRTAVALDVDPKTVRNAAAIASTTMEAKGAAAEAGVTSIRDLRKVAAAPADEQVKTVDELKRLKDQLRKVKGQKQSADHHVGRLVDDLRSGHRDVMRLSDRIAELEAELVVTARAAAEVIETYVPAAAVGELRAKLRENGATKIVEALGARSEPKGAGQ